MKENNLNISYTEQNGILYPNLQVSNEQTADQPLGRYGRMAMEYLKENHPNRYTALKMDGTLMEVMHTVQQTAAEKIEEMTQEMLKKEPMPNTEDTMERTRHLNSLKLSAEQKAYAPEPHRIVTLPDKAHNFKRVYWYLVSVRGVDSQIVSAFMNEKKVYQEAEFSNAVFVGYDRDGTARYCSMRSTYPNSKFKRDADNSDKSYPFFVEGKSDLAIITEAPIDLMSHATLTKMFGNTDWRQDHRLSVGCLSMAALDRYLEWHPEIKNLVFALDNDYLARNQKGELANWGQLAAERAIKAYSEKGYKCALHTPHLNDFNTDLTEIRKGKTPTDLDRQRENEITMDFEKYGLQGGDEKEDLEL